MERTINHKPGPPDRPRILPINETELYEIRTITDLKAGELRWYLPISMDGRADPTRPYKFMGMSPIATPMGVQNLTFELESLNISDALTEWPRKLETTIEQFREKMEEAQRRALIQAGAGRAPGVPRA